MGLFGCFGKRKESPPQTPEAAVKDLFQATSLLSLVLTGTEAAAFWHTVSEGRCGATTASAKAQEVARTRIATAMKHVRDFLSAGDSTTEARVLAELDSALRQWRLTKPHDGTAVEVIAQVFAGNDPDAVAMVKSQVERSDLKGAFQAVSEMKDRQ